MQKSIFKFFLGVFIASLLISCSELKNSTSGSKDPDPAPGTTGNSQSLIRVTSDPIPEFYPKISPDGKRMVFHIRDDNKQGTDKFSIMMMTLGQPGRIPLIGSNTELPSFMNDSKSIVYSYNKPAKPIIAKSSVEGASGINYIGNSNLGDWDSHPCVSPDGKKILFHTKFGDTY